MAQSTKQKIARQAGEMLRLRGYEGTSLNDLVAGAGVSKGAFFHYYPNKQAISREVIETYVTEQLLRPLEKQLSEKQSVKEALFAWLEDFYTDFAAHDFKGGCLLGNLALELSDRSEAAREDIKTHFMALENTLVPFLKSLTEQGKLLMEPRQFARLFINAFQGTVMAVKVHKDHIRASRDFQALAGLIEYLIKD